MLPSTDIGIQLYISNMYLQPTSLYVIYLLKGKAIPLQVWTGPEGSRRLRFPDFKTIGT